MIGAASLRCHCAPSLVLERGEIGSRGAKAPMPAVRYARPVVICSGSGSGTAESGASSVPKLEPFSRSRIERLVKDPPFLQKTENDLTGEFRRLVSPAGLYFLRIDRFFSPSIRILLVCAKCSRVLLEA